VPSLKLPSLVVDASGKSAPPRWKEVRQDLVGHCGEIHSRYKDGKAVAAACAWGSRLHNSGRGLSLRRNRHEAEQRASQHIACGIPDSGAQSTATAACEPPPALPRLRKSFQAILADLAGTPKPSPHSNQSSAPILPSTITHRSASP